MGKEGRVKGIKYNSEAKENKVVFQGDWSLLILHYLKWTYSTG